MPQPRIIPVIKIGRLAKSCGYCSKCSRHWTELELHGKDQTPRHCPECGGRIEWSEVTAPLTQGRFAKAHRPASGQLSMFGGPNQPVQVKPHTRTLPSGGTAQVAGYTEQRRAKKPHEMARSEYLEHRLGTPGSRQRRAVDQTLVEHESSLHRAHVRTAMQSGKTVPPHVLAEYPDLPNPVEKLPHEMTRDEWNMASLHERHAPIAAKRTPEIEALIKRAKLTHEYEYDWLGHALYDAHHGTPAKRKLAIAALDSIGLKHQAATGTFKGGDIVDDREYIVRDALAAGKTVPPHILADYPDLEAKEPTKSKEPHEMTKWDYFNAHYEPEVLHRNTEMSKRGILSDERGKVERDTHWDHRQAVRDALNAGKAVPAEVLADYPDLKPNPREEAKGIVTLFKHPRGHVAFGDEAKIISQTTGSPLEFEGGTARVALPSDLSGHIKKIRGAGYRAAVAMSHQQADMETKRKSAGYPFGWPEPALAYSTGSAYMAQWHEAKKKVPGALLAMRDGDTYRFHGDDAEKAEKVIGSHEFDHGKRDEHLAKLVRAGHRVAIAEQVPKSERPRADIKRIVTSGTIADTPLNQREFHVVPLRKSQDYTTHDHPLPGYPQKLHQFHGAPHAVTTVLHGPSGESPLDHSQHAALGAHHARLGASFWSAGHEDMAQSHFAAARFHHQSARMKRGSSNPTQFVRAGKSQPVLHTYGVGRPESNTQRQARENAKRFGFVRKSHVHGYDRRGPAGQVHVQDYTNRVQKKQLHEMTDEEFKETLPTKDEKIKELMRLVYRAMVFLNDHQLLATRDHDGNLMSRESVLREMQKVDTLTKAVQLAKSVVHAYQRRGPAGQPEHVGEYTNKIVKKPTMPAGHPLWAGANAASSAKPPARGTPTRAVVRAQPDTSAPKPKQFKYKPGMPKPGPSIGQTSSGATIHTDSHRIHAGWSKTDHWEAAQAHRQAASKMGGHEFETELGAPHHDEESDDKRTAHHARAAYHSRLADGDSKGATAIAKYDHRFREHLEGHQAEQHPPASAQAPAVEGGEHDSEQFIANLVQEILGGAKDIGGGRLSVDSQKQNTDANGQYKPERVVMHDRIMDIRLSKAQPVEEPEAIFLGGGSASGKGTIQGSGQLTTPDGAITADADLMKTGDPDGKKTGIAFQGIPEFGQLARGGEANKASAFTHEESSDMNARLVAECLANKYHVVVDGTGDSSPTKLRKKVEAAKAAGHKVRAVYVTVPTDMAVERSMDRAKEMEKRGEPPRRVPETAVREIHTAVSRVFPEAKELFDDIELYDTNVAKGQPGRLIFSKKPGQQETIHDPNLYQEFLDKAKEDHTVEKWDVDAHAWKAGHQSAMAKSIRVPGGRKHEIIDIPHEWPDAERLKRMSKYVKKRHGKGKKQVQPPKRRGRHR